MVKKRNPPSPSCKQRLSEQGLEGDGGRETKPGVRGLVFQQQDKTLHASVVPAGASCAVYCLISYNRYQPSLVDSIVLQADRAKRLLVEMKLIKGNNEAIQSSTLSDRVLHSSIQGLL